MCAVNEGPRPICLRAAIAVIMLCGVAFSPGNCLCEEPTHSALAEESGIGADEWVEVPSSQVPSVLEMLASQTRGNYERIRTWRVSYAYRSRRALSRGQARNLKADLAQAPMAQDTGYELEFVIDVATNAIYRWKKQSTLTWVNTDTKEPVEVPNTAVRNERSVVTPEHCVHLPTDLIHGEFQALAGHPEAKNKRAAFRDAPESNQGKLYVEMIDPGRCYGFDRARKFWENLELNIATLEGKHGADTATMLRDRMRVYQATGPNGVWYRQDLEMGAPGGAKQFVRTTWSAEAGFHPVRFTMGQGEFGEQLFKSTEWRFAQFDGIYVLAWWKDVTYGGGKISHETELTLRDCVLNEPIDPSQFSYAGLGLKDGELVMDRIEGVCYMMKDGEPEKLANFGEKYMPPGASSGIGPLMRWFLIGVAVVGLMAVILFLRARRPKADTEESTG